MVESVIGQQKNQTQKVDGLFDNLLFAIKQKALDKVSPITHRAQDSWFQAQKGFVNTINKALKIELKTTYTEELAQKLKHSHERKIEKQMQKEVGDKLKQNRELYILRKKYYENLLEKFDGDKEADKLIKEARNKELEAINNKYKEMVNPYQKSLNKKLRDDTYLQKQLGQDDTPISDYGKSSNSSSGIDTKAGLEGLHNPKRLNELREALQYRDIVPVEVTNHPEQKTPIPLPIPPQVGKVSEFRPDTVLNPETMESSISKALSSTPLTIEKSQQEQENDFRLEKADEARELETRALEKEFRQSHLDLQEQQVYYLKKITEKEFGGGNGESGGGIIDTVSNLAGNVLDIMSFKKGGKPGLISKGFNAVKNVLGFGGPKGASKAGGIVKGIGNFAKNMMGKGGGKAGGFLAKAGGKMLGSFGRLAAGAAKFAGPVGLALTAANGLYDGFTGAFDDDAITAREGKDAKDITAGDRIKHGAANALSGLTFGLVGKDSIMNVGESFMNFLGGKGWNTNQEVKDTGGDPGGGLFDTMIDASPIGLVKDLVTGNLENNAAFKGASSVANSVMGFLGFDTKKKEKAIDENGNEVEVEKDKNIVDHAKDAFNASPVGWLGKKLGLWGNDDKKEPPKEALEAGVVAEAGNGKGKESPLEANSGENPLPTSHLAEIDRMYGVAPKDDSKAALPLADATTDSPSAQTSSATIVTNNNSTVVQQQGPRYRISDQSTLMLSVQGA